MIYLSRDRLSSDLIAIPLRHFLFRDRLAVCEAAFKDASMEWGLRGLVELPVEVVPVPAAVLAAASDEALDATAKDFLAREVRARLDPRFDDLCATSSRRAGWVLSSSSKSSGESIKTPPVPFLLALARRPGASSRLARASPSAPCRPGR